ncbi:hypothetical protein G6F59_015505 [Rhizopus arrhizus]|nr:hypothetical protein G6F59_015505 [Rhizopus arrhizus]
MPRNCGACANRPRPAATTTATTTIRPLFPKRRPAQLAWRRRTGRGACRPGLPGCRRAWHHRAPAAGPPPYHRRGRAGPVHADPRPWRGVQHRRQSVRSATRGLPGVAAAVRADPPGTGHPGARRRRPDHVRPWLRLRAGRRAPAPAGRRTESNGLPGQPVRRRRQPTAGAGS